MYDIIIIDDHKLLRYMIAETLNSEENFNVVATDGNAKNSISLCEKFNPDLIIMDICTEDNSSGLTYSKKLKVKTNVPNIIANLTNTELKILFYFS